MSILRRLLSPVGIVATLALVIAMASVAIQLNQDSEGNSSPRSAASSTLPPGFQQLGEVWEILRQEHLDRDKFDATELGRGAIRGILQALDDPHAAYLTAEQYAMESANLSGQFSGIGAEVAMQNGRVTIMSPIPDTPAEAAGLRPGDVLLAVNGESIEGISLREAVLMIRGPKGTPVELTIAHRNASEPITLTIIRDNVRVRSVKFRSLVGGIGHLKISSFTDSTPDEVAEALDTFRRRQNSGLVLDLRDNPGGLLSATVEVTSQFLDSGLVLYQVDARGTRRDYPVRPGGIATDIPMVVLMNEFSGSGSEVLIGAIQDHDRAPTIGTKSFGKGSVDTFHRLDDGSAIYFTVARWYTPDGKLIEGKGLEPDVVVSASADGVGDLQLDRAISDLRAMIATS